VKIQVGCGQSPIEGWKNFDNSPSILLAHRPIRKFLAKLFGMTDQLSRQYIEFAKKHDIQWCDARYHIPV